MACQSVYVQRLTRFCEAHQSYGSSWFVLFFRAVATSCHGCSRLLSVFLRIYSSQRTMDAVRMAQLQSFKNIEFESKSIVLFRPLSIVYCEQSMCISSRGIDLQVNRHAPFPTVLRSYCQPGFNALQVTRHGEFRVASSPILLYGPRSILYLVTRPVQSTPSSTKPIVAH